MSLEILNGLLLKARTVTLAKLAAGMAGKIVGYGDDTYAAAVWPPLVQHARAADATFRTLNGSTQQIPGDNTKPQQTEGMEVVTVAITPKAATHKLRIRATVPMQIGGSNTTMVLALFRDDAADAIGVAWHEGDASTNYTHEVVAEVAAGTTDPTTFKLRIGPVSNVTVYANAGVGGGPTFGDLLLSEITVDEIKA